MGGTTFKLNLWRSAAVLLLSSAGLAACGDASQPEAAPVDEAALSAIRLNTDGLNAGAEGFFFNAGKNESIGAVTKHMNAPLGTDAIDECGAGPMELTEFKGGLTLNFLDGALVGWNLRAPIGDEEMAPALIAIAGDVNVGMTREQIEAAAGYEAIPDSTLGDEFTLEGGIGGFLDGENVGMLYAGTQCFFR